jgi:hypothetical protein
VLHGPRNDPDRAPLEGNAERGFALRFAMSADLFQV